MTPTDHGPSPGSRNSRAAVSATGTQRSGARSSDRQRRTSVAPRRAWSPSRRSSAGERAPSVAADGGTVSRPRRGLVERTIVRSSSRARPDSISWPQSARSSAPATVGTRSGRNPRSCRTASPSSSSSAKRRTNSEWSSSSASTNRSRSTTASFSAWTPIAPFRFCHACATPSSKAHVSTPSRYDRVASNARRAVRASEYRPRGRSSVSSTTAMMSRSAGATLNAVTARGMRATWDALASDPDAYVGDPERGRIELESLFGRLGGDRRGGTCVEVGCGPGRMTAALAERFDRVLALDVSPAMLTRARTTVTDTHVEFRAVSGERLDGVAEGAADVVVCYLVLQHLPTRAAVARYLAEFARVLRPGGEAYVQLPVLDDTTRARTWRMLSSGLVPLTARFGPTRRREFRGSRLTRAELDAALAAARLRIVATDVGPDAPYRYSRDLFLRLTR